MPHGRGLSLFSEHPTKRRDASADEKRQRQRSPLRHDIEHKVIALHGNARSGSDIHQGSGRQAPSSGQARGGLASGAKSALRENVSGASTIRRTGQFDLWILKRCLLGSFVSMARHKSGRGILSEPPYHGTAERTRQAWAKLHAWESAQFVTGPRHSRRQGPGSPAGARAPAF